MTCWEWPSRRRVSRLAVALPGSVLTVEPGLLMKTVKAGIIGRILAVFRVDEVAVFRDPDTGPGDAELMASLLSYQATPPHLKKKMFKLSEELRYAGVMPPLKIPSHTPPDRLEEGVVMYGYVEYCRGSLCRVYLGKAGYGNARGPLKPGSMVLVKVVEVRGSKARLEVLDEDSVDIYLGYKVNVYDTVEEAVEDYRRRGFRVVATSKFGECTLDLGCDRPTFIVFGGPKRGLLEYTDPSIYDVVVNTVPMQGTETVRTEEALTATLAILNARCYRQEGP